MATSETDRRRLLGPHLALGAGLKRAAARAEEIGATAVQVFTDNPTAWRRRPEPPAELAEFRTRLAALGIDPIAVHAPYLVNLCGGNDDFWAKSVATMANELKVGAMFGARYVVMHIGSHRGIGRETGIERLALGLRAVLAEADAANARQRDALPMLVLENAAGTGDGIGASIDDLADIWESAARAGVAMDRLGVCLDTAHLWGAGFDIATEAGIANVVSRIDDRSDAKTSSWSISMTRARRSVRASIGTSTSQPARWALRGCAIW